MSVLLRLACLFCVCVSAPSLRAEEPFVFDKNQGRLPKTVLPQRYEVRIEPDLEKAAFSGDETVTLEVRQPVRQIVLHSSGLEISNAKLHGAEEMDLAPQLNTEELTLTFALSKELPPGR